MMRVGTHGELFRCRHGAKVAAVAWSPTGSRLASADNGGGVYVWDGAGHKQGALVGHRGLVQALAWSPDGTLLASAGEDTKIRIWRSADHGLVHVLRGHRDLIRTLAWSPDGAYLASASDDRTIRLWDSSGQLDLTLGGP